MSKLTAEQISNMTDEEIIESMVLLFNETDLDDLYVALTRALAIQELEDLHGMLGG
jgi:hypothetical protein